MLRAIRTRSGVTFFLVFLVAVGILLRNTGRISPLQDFAYTIFKPVQITLIGASTGISNLFGGFQEVNSLREQVKQLEAQLNKLTVDTVRIKELETENSLLREQLNYKQSNPDYALLGAAVLQRNPDLATVLGRDPSDLVNYVVIDQGREDGVAVGMPVVTPAGLVGRVSEIGSRWARVLLIVDPSSSVNGLIQSSRATGVIQGQIGSTLLMKYLPQGEAVKVNDLVLTSGIGGRFPKRLVIGQVVDVRKRDTDLFQEAVVRPSVDFNRLEFVLVVKKFTPTDITQEVTATPTKPAPTPTKAPAQ